MKNENRKKIEGNVKEQEGEGGVTWEKGLWEEDVADRIEEGRTRQTVTLINKNKLRKKKSTDHNYTGRCNKTKIHEDKVKEKWKYKKLKTKEEMKRL